MVQDPGSGPWGRVCRLRAMETYFHTRANDNRATDFLGGEIRASTPRTTSGVRELAMSVLRERVRLSGGFHAKGNAVDGQKEDIIDGLTIAFRGGFEIIPPRFCKKTHLDIV